jgi:hypothetical protein
LSDVCDEYIGDEGKGCVEIYDRSWVDRAVAEFCEAGEGAGCCIWEGGDAELVECTNANDGDAKPNMLVLGYGGKFGGLTSKWS